MKIWYNHKSEVLTANIFLPLANRITISLDCIYDTGFKICLVRYVSQCLTLNWFYSFECNLALMFWLTARPCLHISKLNFCSLYMSKGFAEIRHFRKCLDFPQLPRHLQKMLFFDKRINSLIQAFNYWFIHCIIHPIINSLLYSSFQTFIHSLHYSSFNLFIALFILSFIHLIIHPHIHLFIHSYIHPFI